MNTGDKVKEKKKVTPKWSGQLSGQPPSGDLASLQQQVAWLAERVLSLEHEIKELCQAFSELEGSEDYGTDEEPQS